MTDPTVALAEALCECSCMAAGPKFIRFFWPVLGALRDLGGSAKPREVVDLVLEMLHIDDDERAERTKSGALRIDNQVHWARN